MAVPEERAAVILTTDISGSMEARDVSPSRMAAVRRAALDFLDDAPGELRVGAVAFNHSVRSIEPPRADRDRHARAAGPACEPSGGTATGEGLAAALGAARAATARANASRPPAAVILLSDGASTHGRDPIDVAREAARLRIPVYTVALGTDAGTIEVEGRNGATVTRAGAARPRRDAADRDDQRRAHLQRRRGRPARRRLRAARLAGGHARGAARGDRGVRRRRGRAAAGRAARLSLRWFGRLP